jgi:hypothetical protein
MAKKQTILEEKIKEYQETRRQKRRAKYWELMNNKNNITNNGEEKK